ncbi:MAG: hypothetical protein CMF38_07245 [Legionellaceae bacterium]|nr:hypothetical protein [Legionellaceae bacterium]
MLIDNKFFLNQNASNFLFENYATLRRIFSDFIGQLDIAYISYTFISKNNEVFFISSSPAIEQNLIEKNLWCLDLTSLQPFLLKDKFVPWAQFINELSFALRTYKYDKFLDGYCMLTSYQEFIVITFLGFNKKTLTKTVFNSSKFLALSSYCLQKIHYLIPLPTLKGVIRIKPFLQLIVNNTGT